VRLYLRSADRRKDPEPLPTDDRRVILVGTVIWAVLFVVGMVARPTLAADGHGWWVWTPPVGIALGLYGLRYLRRRQGPPPPAPERHDR
jgi:hypothetical protein